MKGPITVFVCGRDKTYPSVCATPGCSGQVRATCDYALGGARSGQTCDRALCERCTRRVGEKDFCRAHAAIVGEPKGAR